MRCEFVGVEDFNVCLCKLLLSRTSMMLPYFARGLFFRIFLFLSTLRGRTMEYHALRAGQKMNADPEMKQQQGRNAGGPKALRK